MQFFGVMQQELEHQRQLMELMQQMQQQMRQMQHQEQQAHEAQTQQGALPSGGNERQSQQLIMKGAENYDAILWTWFASQCSCLLLVSWTTVVVSVLIISQRSCSSSGRTVLHRPRAYFWLQE